jgi:hypothetical protein
MVTVLKKCFYHRNSKAFKKARINKNIGQFINNGQFIHETPSKNEPAFPFYSSE